MLPAVFDFLNGPVRDLVTQIYEAVGYLGVALWVAIESVDHPDPVRARPAVRRLPRRRRDRDRAADRPALVVLARRRGGHPGRDRGRAHRLRDRGVGRPPDPGALGSLPRDLGRRSRPGGDVLRTPRRGGELLRPDDPGRPLAGVLRRRASPGCRSGGSRCSRSWARSRSPRSSSSPGVQLGANWEAVGAILKRFEYAIVAVLVVIALAWSGSGSSSRVARAGEAPPG